MHYPGLQADELNMKYKRMSQEEAEPGWNEVFEASLDSCMHGAYCQQGADCQVSPPAARCGARVKSCRGCTLLNPCWLVLNTANCIGMLQPYCNYSSLHLQYTHPCHIE